MVVVPVVTFFQLELIEARKAIGKVGRAAQAITQPEDISCDPPSVVALP